MADQTTEVPYRRIRRAAEGSAERDARQTAAGPAKRARGPADWPVVVVFVDHASCPWLRLLRRGFRHCFVVLRLEPVWLACEPLKDRIELDALALPADFDLPAFYRDQGYRVLVGRRPPPRPRRRLALAPLTCVTVVKRLLGIDAPWVWTPWQLFVHLLGPEADFQLCPGSRPSDGSAPSNSGEKARP